MVVVVVVLVVAGTAAVVVVVARGDVVGDDAIVDGTVVDGGVVTGGTVVDGNGAVVADPAAGVAIGDTPDEALPVVRRAFGAMDVGVPGAEAGAGVEVGTEIDGTGVDNAVVDVPDDGDAERWLTVA